MFVRLSHRWVEWTSGSGKDRRRRSEWLFIHESDQSENSLKNIFSSRFSHWSQRRGKFVRRISTETNFFHLFILLQTKQDDRGPMSKESHYGHVKKERKNDGIGRDRFIHSFILILCSFDSREKNTQIHFHFHLWTWSSGRARARLWPLIDFLHHWYRCAFFPIDSIFVPVESKTMLRNICAKMTRRPEQISSRLAQSFDSVVLSSIYLPSTAIDPNKMPEVFRLSLIHCIDHGRFR